MPTGLSISAFRPDRETVGNVIPLFQLLVGYSCLNHLILNAYSLPEEAFESRFLAVKAFEHLFSTHAGLADLGLRVGLLVVLGAVLWRGRTGVFGGWSRSGGAKDVRALVLVTAAAIAWYFSSYDYNLYFD